MAWTALTPADTSPPVAPYSFGAACAEGWVFTAGIVALDDDGATVGLNDVKAQTRRVLEIIAGIVAAGGGTLRDVVCVQIFLRDYADYGAMNEVYREFFGKNGATFPPRYCIRVDLVKPEWLVEIAVTAKIG
jgi:aminoacrylate peracid reductase